MDALMYQMHPFLVPEHLCILIFDTSLGCLRSQTNPQGSCFMPKLLLYYRRPSWSAGMQRRNPNGTAVNEERRGFKPHVETKPSKRLILIIRMAQWQCQKDSILPICATVVPNAGTNLPFSARHVRRSNIVPRTVRELHGIEFIRMFAANRSKSDI